MSLIFRFALILVVSTMIASPALASADTGIHQTNRTQTQTPAPNTPTPSPTPTPDVPQVQDERTPKPVAIEDTQTPDSTPRPADVSGSEAICDEVVDSRTRLCNAEYRNGTIHLTLKSDGAQILTITDAGGALERGEVRRRQVTVPDDRPVTIAMPATEHSNKAAVTIDTGSALYAVPVTTGTTLIGGPWTLNDVRNSAASAAVSVSLITLFVAWRRLSGRNQDPERIA